MMALQSAAGSSILTPSSVSSPGTVMTIQLTRPLGRPPEIEKQSGCGDIRPPAL